MTVTRSLTPTGLAALAAGTMLALAACSPAAPAVTSPSAGTPSPSPSSTASASPTASPGTSATVGQIVEGFPEALIPVMPGATVISSSFDKASSPATVALVASRKASASAVVDFYSKHLEKLGFKAVPGDAVGAVASKDFVRKGNETVNVAVVQAAGVSTFTIGANVAVESAK